MIVFSNIKLNVNKTEKDLIDKISRTFHIDKTDIINYKILKRSLDARQGLFFVYKVGMNLKHMKKYQKFPTHVEEEMIIPKTDKMENICIIGFGPSAIFASLVLARAGHNVTVFEKGASVDERVLKVEDFFNNSILDEATNIQFGEGGAGTFSDGKLNTRTKSIYNQFVLDTLVSYGAASEIAYVHNPHVGTDVLRTVVKNIREDLISMGAKINFLSEVSDFNIENNEIKEITVNDQKYSFDKYILAIGNSARDTFRKLHSLGVEMESKSLAVGFRVEHIQENINIAQFREEFQNPNLGAAEYKLVNNNSGCYTFCMCPGGEVVNGASVKNASVTNGMSYYKRDNLYANSAVLVNVPKTESALGLIDFQEQIEKDTYNLSGSYKLPAMNIKDFVSDNKELKELIFTPSVKIGTVLKDIRNIYPKEITDLIKESLIVFDRRINGFLNGVIIASETRSSSPVRILRSELGVSNIKNLYPIGEGAGYAGGITSSAMDGVKIAQIINKAV